MGKFAGCPCAKGECDIFCGICNTSMVTLNISSYSSSEYFYYSGNSQDTYYYTVPAG